MDTLGSTKVMAHLLAYTYTHICFGNHDPIPCNLQVGETIWGDFKIPLNQFCYYEIYQFTYSNGKYCIFILRCLVVICVVVVYTGMNISEEQITTCVTADGKTYNFPFPSSLLDL